MNSYLKLLEEARQSLANRLSQHSFLRRCRERTVDMAELQLFLVQQGIYSSYFTRYLCALMSNLPSNDLVLKLAENLCEELGLTDDSQTPHSVLYQDMLKRFNVSLQAATPTVGTRRLINTMFDHCRDPEPARGLGALCLGAEALVPALYTEILSGFDGAGVSAASVGFFCLHVECDDGHTETMLEIMAELWKGDAAKLPIMISAGRAMVDSRLGFFDSIEEFGRQSKNATGSTDVDLNYCCV